jgi:urease accessory protein
VKEDALFCYLPDPVCGYKDSEFEQIQRFDMSTSSSLVLVDWYSCGRGTLRDEFWDQHRIGKAILSAKIFKL